MRSPRPLRLRRRPRLVDNPAIFELLAPFQCLDAPRLGRLLRTIVVSRLRDPAQVFERSTWFRRLAELQAVTGAVEAAAGTEVDAAAGSASEPAGPVTISLSEQRGPGAGLVAGLRQRRAA